MNGISIEDLLLGLHAYAGSTIAFVIRTQLIDSLIHSAAWSPFVIHSVDRLTNRDSGCY